MKYWEDRLKSPDKTTRDRARGETFLREKVSAAEPNPGESPATVVVVRSDPLEFGFDTFNARVKTFPDTDLKLWAYVAHPGGASFETLTTEDSRSYDGTGLVFMRPTRPGDVLWFVLKLRRADDEPISVDTNNFPFSLEVIH